jgi:hypothetical protein
VKIGMPAVLITAAVLATAVTACSSSPSATSTKSHRGASPGITAGPEGVAAVLSSNPVCRRFQQDLKAWKTGIAEPGDVSTVLLNASTRPAWLKFGRQLEQLSQADIGSKDPKVAARTVKDLARTAVLLREQGSEPFRQFTGAQYQRTVTLLEDVTGDCAALG